MEQTFKRKLAAILMADVVGYSRLMGEDEAATVRTLKAYREVFADQISSNDGRVVNAPGDSILADFGSVVDAVAAAVEIQRKLAEKNRELPSGRVMQFRIGINLGDVVAEEGAIYGDGVNIAARLESLADPGGIAISRSAFDQVDGKLPINWEYTGEHNVKNIAKPLRAYRLLKSDWLDSKADSAGLGAMPAEDTTANFKPPTVPNKPSIAVLPFVNMSGDPEQEYFVDGITEEIITDLSRFSSLDVIARNSTFRYKGQPVDVRQIGQDLGVRYVLEGSVRKSGSRIRITVQLLDATTGAHLWADSYDRELTADNIFDLQKDLSERVAGTIADRWGIISRSRMEEAKRRSADDIDPDAAVLRAYDHFSNQSREGHLQVRDALERAVELNPNHAEAWATLALTYRDEHGHNYNPRPDPLGRAMKAARRAIELDSRNSSGQSALYQILFYQRDEAFFTEVERALALNPNSPSVLAMAGSYLTRAGQWERGVALGHRAIALDPNRQRPAYATFQYDHYRKGEYEQALAQALKIDWPEYFWTHLIFAMNYGQLGRGAEAKAAVARLLKLYPDFGQHARATLRKWFWEDELVEHMIDGLRKAGLDIPEEK